MKKGKHFFNQLSSKQQKRFLDSFSKQNKNCDLGKYLFDYKFNDFECFVNEAFAFEKSDFKYWNKVCFKIEFKKQYNKNLFSNPTI